MTDCPNCEYHKNRAARWRAEAYKHAGYDIELPWVDLNTNQILDIYQEVLKEWRGGHQVNGQIAFANAIQIKLKELNT